jgi:spore coat polysaccharide biosynthesis protein SpsF
MNICAIIQARLGSTRLPKKLFLDLSGKPLIWHVINRLTFSKQISKIILATTDQNIDDELVDWSKKNNIDYFRGDENDVLSRYYLCSKKINADIIIRITSDDPFKDPFLIDRLIEILLKEKLDFIFNNYPPSYPEGLDTEIFTFDALEKAYLNTNSKFDREHVTQFFYKNIELFNTRNILNNENLSNYRWTIDTELDYELIRKIYDLLYENNKLFNMKDILNLYEDFPFLHEINCKVKRSDMYKNL